jgi:hypothetical protein
VTISVDRPHAKPGDPHYQAPLLDHEFPATRGDCNRRAIRPCPYVGCRHHLYLDVNPENGTIKLNFPDLEVWELPETCSLDVAERGGVTLEEVGEILNLTRERIRQIQVMALRVFDKELPPELQDPDADS